MADWIVLVIGALCCLTVDADLAADSDKHPVDLLVPDKKVLTMESADQSPAETKHWWYGHKYDWDKKHHGEHGEHGGKWEGKHKKIWWWKWF